MKFTEIHNIAVVFFPGCVFWQKVLRMLADGEMPPKDSRPLSAHQMSRFIGWVRSISFLAFAAVKKGHEGLGRVPGRHPGTDQLAVAITGGMGSGKSTFSKEVQMW